MKHFKKSGVSVGCGAIFDVLVYLFQGFQRCDIYLTLACQNSINAKISCSYIPGWIVAPIRGLSDYTVIRHKGLSGQLCCHLYNCPTI